MMINFYENLDLSAKSVWFPITFSIAILIFVVFMPKRLKKREIYFTFCVVGYVAFMLDIFVLATVFDVFDLGNPMIVGIGDILSYGIIAPCMAILFINFYKKEHKWIYVLIFTVISFLYEILLINLGYMQLHSWNSIFSIFVHIISYGFWFPLHLKLMRK